MSERTTQPDSPPNPGDDGARRVAEWVDQHGDYLFAYAVPRVRDRHVAEEIVQETFLAALEAVGSYRGDSSPRTWLVGLLRRKIADHYRRSSRLRAHEPLDTSDAAIDAWFDRRGHWIDKPKRWSPDVADLQQRRDFWVVFQRCFDALPGRLGDAFALKVLEECPADEVCKLLGISATNLWVLLHRARARLRACLETNWFEAGEAK